MSPLISVISGIYNCADTLREAIESILAQTVTDWEWILCDDASSDDTWLIAKEYAEKYPDKFILLKNEQNMGLNYTLNRCLRHANGKYIARMDGDDRCSPERFAAELAVLTGEENIAIVSTDMEHFDEHGIWGAQSRPEYPTAQDFIHGIPFCHAPCMVRREAYEAVNGYSEEKRHLRVEDYHLWIKMYSMGFRGKNIHKPLYQMRDDRNAYSRRKFAYRLNEAGIKAFAVKELKLPVYNYLLAIRPVLVGLLPSGIYDWLHKNRLKEK